MSEAVDLLCWQLRVTDAPTPVTEFPFAKEQGRKFRADLAFPERMLLVEVDGGTWIQGRHSQGAGYERDCEKQSLAAVLGFRTMRFTPSMIQSGRALSLLLAALQWRAA